jgi:N-acetylneuraminate synthase
MDAFEIGHRPVGPDAPTFVIAEAGSNHNGDLELAKELIDVAVDAGADAVKFQTFRADKLYIDDRDLGQKSAYEVISELELPYDWISDLYEYCNSQDIFFISTPFDEESAAELAKYAPALKIASASLSYHPLLESVASYDKPILLSTGVHGPSEIADAIELLEERGVDNIVLLHCISSYPTPVKEINVRAVRTLGEEFETIVGLSDHTTDPVIAPTAAVSLGASVIEKHITVDKKMDGPDHSFALEPDELEEMVDTIRQTERALGSGDIGIAEIESGAVNRARRSIFVIEDIQAGKKIHETSVRALRPGYSDRKGLSPTYMSDIIGSRALEDLEKGQPISADQIDAQIE